MSDVSPKEVGPYRNFRVVVYFGESDWPVAGFHDASGPGPAGAWDGPVTLAVGVTHDAEFAAWVSAPAKPGAAGVSGGTKDLRFDLKDERGRVTASVRFRGCRITECLLMPDLDSGALAMTVERLEIAHEGWT